MEKRRKSRSIKTRDVARGGGGGGGGVHSITGDRYGRNDEIRDGLSDLPPVPATPETEGKDRSRRRRGPFEDGERVDPTKELNSGLAHVELGLKTIEKYPSTPEIRAMKKSFLNVRERIMSRLKKQSTHSAAVAAGGTTVDAAASPPHFERKGHHRVDQNRGENGTPWTIGNLTPSLFRPGGDRESPTSESKGFGRSKHIYSSSPAHVFSRGTVEADDVSFETTSAMKNLDTDLEAIVRTEEQTKLLSGTGNKETVDRLIREIRQRDRQLLQVENQRKEAEVRLTKVIGESERVVMSGLKRQSEQIARIDELSGRVSEVEMERNAELSRRKEADRRAAVAEEEVERLRTELALEKRKSSSMAIKLGRLRRRQETLIRGM